MRFELEVFARVLADQFLQFFEHNVRLGLGALGEHILVVHDLRAHHPVDGRLIDADFPQPVCQFIPVLAAEELGR